MLTNCSSHSDFNTLQLYVTGTSLQSKYIGSLKIVIEKELLCEGEKVK